MPTGAAIALLLLTLAAFAGPGLAASVGQHRQHPRLRTSFIQKSDSVDDDVDDDSKVNVTASDNVSDIPKWFSPFVNHSIDIDVSITTNVDDGDKVDGKIDANVDDGDKVDGKVDANVDDGDTVDGKVNVDADVNDNDKVDTKVDVDTNVDKVDGKGCNGPCAKEAATSFSSKKVQSPKVSFNANVDKDDDNDSDKDDDNDDDDDDDQSAKEKEAKQKKQEERKRQLKMLQEKIEHQKFMNMSGPIAKFEKAKHALMDNKRRQKDIEREMRGLDDDEGFDKKLSKTVSTVANETQSKHMAHFLGEMWREMRMFATPFYMEHLEEKLDDLKRQEPKLTVAYSKAKRAKEQKDIETSEKVKEEEEEDEEDEPAVKGLPNLRIKISDGEKGLPRLKIINQK